MSTSAETASAKLTEAAANGAVIAKLAAFSLAMAFLPLSSYFLSLSYLFNGNTTYAALLAAGAANVVLVCYVLVAIFEDGSGPGQPPLLVGRAVKPAEDVTEEKKAQ